MTNKKTIHRIPCFRFKITAMVLHRAGGLNYTKRFTHAQVVDTGDYADSTILVVEMTQGLCRMPVNLRVRRFHPRKGDVINRRYIENGVSKEQELQPYCLADVEKTAKEFAKYIDDNALDGLEEAVKNSDDIVKQTFCMIARECRGLNVRAVTSKHRIYFHLTTSLCDTMLIIFLWPGYRAGEKEEDPEAD